MPEFYQQSSFTSDPSQLSEGWKPAFLCLITDDPKPDGWQMKGTRMWRWHFAVWNSPEVIPNQAPEHQSAPSSQTFSPGGKNPPSKAYLWTVQLLGRRPQPGEHINLDPLLPLPCRVKVSRMRNDGTPIDFANIKDLEAWHEGSRYLANGLKETLQALAQTWAQDSQQANQQTPSPTTPPHSVQVNPGMVGWGNPQGHTATVQPAKPSW